MKKGAVLIVFAVLLISLFSLSFVSATAVTLSEGEERAITINGINHNIKLSAVSQKEAVDEVFVSVDGGSIVGINEGSSSRVGGLSIYAKSVFYSAKEAAINSAILEIISSSNNSTTITCIDSDAGKDYFVKGKAIDTTGQHGYFQDKCMSEDGMKNVTECTGSSCRLLEGYCDGNNLMNIAYTCPNGCRDGACVTTTNVTTITLSEGEERAITVSGVRHTVKLDSINQKESVSGVLVSVDGGVKWYIGEGQSSQVGGLSIYAKSVFYSAKEAAINSAILEISAAGKESAAEIVIAPNETTGAIEIPEEVSSFCDGCELDKKCFPFGYRKTGVYCSEDGKFISQLKESKSCDNSFECSSNVCVSGQCISEGFIQRILNWFKSLFGGKE
jgi:hypothetical protein